MPSGKTHDRLTAVTAALSVPAWLLLSPKHDSESFVAGLGAYLFSGYWLSGDLDTNSVCYKRWGVFKFLWWPYRTVVPHRSCLSHGPIIGPVIRVVYFAVAVWLTFLVATTVIDRYFLIVDKTGILQHAKLSLTGWVSANLNITIAALIGLVLGGLTHTFADVIGSFWKKIW